MKFTGFLVCVVQAERKLRPRVMGKQFMPVRCDGAGRLLVCARGPPDSSARILQIECALFKMGRDGRLIVVSGVGKSCEIFRTMFSFCGRDRSISLPCSGARIFIVGSCASYCGLGSWVLGSGVVLASAAICLFRLRCPGSAQHFVLDAGLRSSGDGWFPARILCGSVCVAVLLIVSPCPRAK
jgi:hypothetical protein